MQTEVEFTLPVGLADDAGTTHRDGVMRLATARDEIQPLGDPLVRRNEAYLTVLLLARTVERIGIVTSVTADVIEGLFAADFDHLQRLYERINTPGAARGHLECPGCHEQFDVDLRDVQDGPSGA
jgi:hypothetical protein